MIRTVEQAVRYALLRGGEHWLDSVTLSGVEVQPDGSIDLRRVPGVVPPVLAAPGVSAPSGIALDGTCGLYLADAAEYAVLRLALDCKDRLRWPGKADPLSAPVPAGICLGPLDRLYVADPQHGRIVVLTTPDLNPVATWQAGLKSPTWLAADKARAIVVSDPGSGHLIRVDPLGRRDPDFDANFSLPAGATSPRCVGVDGDGVSYLA